MIVDVLSTLFAGAILILLVVGIVDGITRKPIASDLVKWFVGGIGKFVVSFFQRDNRKKK